MSPSEQSWSGLPRAELEALLEEGLAHADEAVRAAWERIRIPPEKWQCSPQGDLGGGFWAVAVDGASVVWFNDIEDGFNVSPFSTRGVIGDYRCNETSFEEFLRSLPEAREGEGFAIESPASAVPEALTGPGTVLRRQTTYWELRAASGSRWRVHFSEVQEKSYARADYERADVLGQHPLLLDYTEPWADVYISGPGTDPSAVLDEVERRISAATGGWRRLGHYRAGMAPERLLQVGYGLLLRGPRSVVDAAAAALRDCAVPASILEERITRERGFKLFLLGSSSFIIARAFRFEPLSAE